ncbi:hypothetical protein [Fusobacterium sp. PH5-44]|uniref:hypothetical protein n=1 Tax=unclassified Fusobacterium TaxID=2648384 RepID=UPI003D24C56F
MKKRIVFVIVLMMLSGFIFADVGINVLHDSMITKRDEKIYVKNEKIPFTGIIVQEFVKGEITGNMEVVNGLYHGDMIFFHKNGKPYTSFKMINGKFQDGTAKLYGEKGLQVGRITFKNGKIIEQVRYRNGEVIRTRKNLTLEDVIYE